MAGVSGPPAPTGTLRRPGNVIKDVDLPPEITASSPSPSTASGSPDHPAQVTTANACKSPIPSEGLDLDAYFNDMEKASYPEAIRRKDGNREAATRLLGIKPYTFRKRAKEKFGL